MMHNTASVLNQIQKVQIDKNDLARTLNRNQERSLTEEESVKLMQNFHTS